MRRIAFFALTAFLAGACQSALVETKEDIGPDQFYATIETPANADTKVYADENLKVLWNADDRITIFNQYTLPVQYQFTGEEGSNSGGFSAVPNPDEDEFNVGNDLDYIYAVYPYDEKMTISNSGVVNVTLPAVQAYKENSFGVGANTMVSVTSDKNLRFKNACGYLAFKVYGNNVAVSSVSLKGNNSEKLAGSAKITMAEGGLPSVAMQSRATEILTLECASPVTVGTSSSDYTEFWFAVPPTTFSQGFTVTFTSADGGTVTKSLASSIAIERNSLKRMAAFELVPEAAPAGPAITIDGDFDDWDEIEGTETPNNICKVMKVTNDKDCFYFYLASEPGSRGSQLWGEAAGYYYLDFDWDNDESTGIAENSNPGFDCWCYLYIFGGSSTDPVIKLHPNGGSKEMSISNITAMGSITDDLIEIELSIPRSDMVAVAAGTVTRILSWRSKDGTKITSIYTVK